MTIAVVDPVSYTHLDVYKRQIHVAAGHQLALVEASFRVDLGLVIPEGLDLVLVQEFELGDADAVFTGDCLLYTSRCV